MPTINIPPKKKESGQDIGPVSASQRRPKNERYRLQVDRQMKASFSTLMPPRNQAAQIKKANPVVKVAISDAESNTTKVIE